MTKQIDIQILPCDSYIELFNKIDTENQMILLMRCGTITQENDLPEFCPTCTEYYKEVDWKAIAEQVGEDYNDWSNIETLNNWINWKFQ